MNTIKIGDKTYPMRTTMGAFVQFKRNRGIDISEAGNDTEAVCYFMYECIKSACRVDGVSFDLSFEDFADRIDFSDLSNFQQTQSSGDSVTTKKK